MRRRIEILAEAADEAAEATRWYEEERVGLGAESEAAIDAALSLLEVDPIPSVPAAGVAAKRGARRIVLRRFPFDLVFIESGPSVRVIAFSHHRGRPGFWRHRTRA
jgi:hypothetical protein